MIADSIADPLPNVDGSLGDPEHIRGHIDSVVNKPVEFEIGDIVELQPERDNDPIYCRISEVHLSHNLLVGQYDPIPPTSEAPMGLSIHEIADDVIAVHDQPPGEEK